MKIKLLFILTFIVNFSFGQSLKNEIDSIYNFQPGKLSQKEQENKLPSLDGFWAKVKNDTTQFLPQLRKELISNGHNPFFYFNGSGLLLTLSNQYADKAIAAEAIYKCDIEDISREIYVHTLNQLANDGLNVTKAAIKILTDENYYFFIPQHAMTFNQGYCLTYMLLPQKDKSYLDTLINLFNTVKPSAQKSIITALWFEASCKGDSFLKSLSSDGSVGEEVKKYAVEILGYTKLAKDVERYLKKIGNKKLADLRALSLNRFSDEAIEELDMTTRFIRKTNNCP